MSIHMTPRRAVADSNLTAAGNRARSTRSRLVLALTVISLVALLPLSAVLGNSGLDAVTEIDCNPTQTYADAGDADAAAALEAAGYSCTKLLNKGQLPTTYQQVGELWFRQVGTILQMRVIFFGGANTGFGDEKICLDDDPDPINDIAPGNDNPDFCEGGSADNTASQGADSGPSYPPAKAAGVAPEEGAGQMELMIENLIEISEVFGGTTVGGWNVNIDGYTEALPHFNLGGFSIVAYFQPEQNGTKSGHKYEDENANGNDDSGDADLSGWKIWAIRDANANGELEQSEYDAAVTANSFDVTDPGYSFSLAPGKYFICEETQSGWTQSSPQAGDTDFTAECDDLNATVSPDLATGGYLITVTSGSVDTGNEFGNFQAGTKSGTKFEDENANGTDDGAGDAGLSGWTIKAFHDNDNSNTLNTGDTFATSTTTDGNGDYTLTLAPGEYVVCEVQQANWTQSAPSNTICEFDAIDNTLAPGGFDVTITSGSSEVDNDFGNWTTASKSGFKFYDNDADGSFEPLPSPQNDTKLSGWTIELWKLNGMSWAFVASDVTDGTGYSFTGLAPGTYAVCEILQANYTQSFPFSGATLPADESVFDCTQLTPNGAGTFAPFGIQFTATSGAALTNNNFGNFLLPPGCTLTQGYWKTHSVYGPAAHPDDTWNLITAATTGGSFGTGPDSEFFDSGDTWLEVFRTSPKGGNAWYILAHQYMAAVLNQLNGAGGDLGTTLTAAASLLDQYDNQKNFGKKDPNRDLAIELAGVLAQYNEGNAGIPHCGEEGFAGFTTQPLAGIVMPPLLPMRRRRVA
ncbi:MAG: hypothetical protein M3Y83_05185 [Actinomycetota bacterium]|nr:hypothetical protein [Actinomycetota bacterium]